jgi:hypothetical protein
MGIQPALSQDAEETEYRQWVEYQDGALSLAFAQAPVAVALHEIRERTGFQIIVPSAAQNKLVNLRLSRSPIEPAVRSLLSSIGLKNFAMIYDETGRPHRAVVLGGVEERVAVASSASIAVETVEPAAQPLTAQERDKLQKELERWTDLTQEDRGRIEDRLKALPPSQEREELFKEYGRQILGVKK